MELWTLIATIAVLGSAIHLIPQIIKGIKTKHMGDVSWWMLSTYFVACLAWLSYGIHIGDLPLTTVSVFNVTASVVNLGLKVKYK